jgi:hypothetical protein
MVKSENVEPCSRSSFSGASGVWRKIETRERRKILDKSVRKQPPPGGRSDGDGDGNSDHARRRSLPLTGSTWYGRRCGVEMALLEVRAKTDDASVRAKTDYAPLQRQIVRRRGRFEVGLHGSKRKQNF